MKEENNKLKEEFDRVIVEYDNPIFNYELTDEYGSRLCFIIRMEVNGECFGYADKLPFKSIDDIKQTVERSQAGLLAWITKIGNQSKQEYYDRRDNSLPL